MGERYFISYMPYSDDINNVCVLVGETKEYYKIKSTSRVACEYMIRKSNLMLRGSDIRFHEVPKEELLIKIRRQKTIQFLQRFDFRKLDSEQLEKIRKIVMEEKI